MEKYNIKASFTDTKIVIDGIMSEPVWQQAEVATNFQQNKPIDGVAADAKTEVRVLHSSDALYVFANCKDNKPYVINTLKRDNYGSSDEFGVVIDPQGVQTNGYGFGVNSYGAQTEVLLLGNNIDASWDNKWFSKVERNENGYTVEIAIPFETLRFPTDKDKWAINFIRRDPGLNQVHAWAPVPRQFDETDLGYFGTLHLEVQPKRIGINIPCIPYVSSIVSKENNVISPDITLGGDAKIAITPSLNLDLTVKPDFSQVEVDQQVTNLTRFNIFFPERRQFFIENGDMFSAFGLNGDEIFYSRKIGLDVFNNKVPINSGLRLTGNLTNKTRIGLLNMTTSRRPNSAANNYTAATFQQRILKRSQIRGVFLNRQSKLTSIKFDPDDFGRNIGGDFKYSSDNGIVQAYGGYLMSIKSGIANNDAQEYIGVSYNGKLFQTFVEAQHTGREFYSDMGFNGRIENYDPINNTFIRIGYTNIGSMLNYNYYPTKSKHVNQHWSGLENFVWINDHGYGLNEWYTRLRHFIFFKNTTELRFRLNNNYNALIFPFELAGETIPVGKYHNTEFNIQYNSDSRRLVQGSVFAVYGTFFEGTKLTYRANILARAQPWGNITLGLEDNILRFDGAQKAKHISLVNGRIEFTFSTKLFFTNFLQYNTQAKRFNINSRFQYRYAPMSDIFLVFTDDYIDTDRWTNKGRSVVLKVNYWLNI